MKGWLLDTNVVSETVRPRPEPRVLAWLGDRPQDRTFISILTLAELEQGIETLPVGDPRRDRLRRFANRIEAEFVGRILHLDDAIVRLAGRISGRYQARYGGKAPTIDAMLAATAELHQLSVATRNVRHLQPLGAVVFNPWIDDLEDDSGQP